MRHRSEAITNFQVYVTEFNAYGTRAPGAAPRTIGSLHTDNAGELTSLEFKEYCDAHNIAFTTCPAYTHQLNGVAERAVGTIATCIRTSLLSSGAPASFWAYAALHACDILNRTTGPPGSSMSSHEALTGAKPSVMDILPFGCRTYVVQPRVLDGFSRAEDAPSWLGINLGKHHVSPGHYHV